MYPQTPLRPTWSTRNPRPAPITAPLSTPRSSRTIPRSCTERGPGASPLAWPDLASRRLSTGALRRALSRQEGAIGGAGDAELAAGRAQLERPQGPPGGDANAVLLPGLDLALEVEERPQGAQHAIDV